MTPIRKGIREPTRSSFERLISEDHGNARALMHRLYLTAHEYEALLLKQNGKCCVDDCEQADLVAEHSTPNAWRRAKPDQLMCTACHKVKTLRDIRAIWKVKRLNGDALSQYERRRKYGAQLRGRPFEKPHHARGAASWKR